jgi:hypothetical protein
MNQVIAAEKGVRSRNYEKITKKHHSLGQPDLIMGIEKVYTPLDENSAEILQPESKKVQLDATKALEEVRELFLGMWDVIATKDFGNTQAKADLIVGEAVLIKNAPVTLLLTLSKQLDDMHSLVKNLPVLDPSEDWERDANTDSYRSQPKKTTRTQKVTEFITAAPATDKFPAQVHPVVKDVTVGTWTTTKFSGALPAKKVNDMLKRVETLQRAVKFAREEANTTEVENLNVCGKLVEYIFSD